MKSEHEEFVNEPLMDFSRPENKEQMLEAIRRLEEERGRVYDLVIAGERVKTNELVPSTNPSVPSEPVGNVMRAGRGELERALAAAVEVFESWKWVDAAERADLLFRAAVIMRRRRLELNACMVLEVGKSWVEADADTAEAIDFLEFYGREALRYDAPQPVTPIPGERNELFYIPLGVGAVIPPWNFPLAILAGMTSASVVSGNTVVLKPATDSPIIGAKFMEVMEEAGLPPGVINFMPGRGSQVGDPLVDDRRTRFITFTGSKEVGLRIAERASRVAPGQIWIKRVVAEMGGKDSIVVDSEADLEEAARGVMASAFGFQGQKCSACSRAIVVADVYDALLEKLMPLVEGIKVGDPRDPEVFMGPVVNQAAKEKTLEYIEIGRKEGRLLAGGEALAGEGYFIAPTVFGEVPPEGRVSLEEIFGPVLALIRVADFDEALKVANNTEYGLTGSVYSRNRDRLARARKEFHVGNLYLNRKCTGALVGGHPFGGFNMSGTDSKAGGRDYLLLFCQAKSVSEKVS